MNDRERYLFDLMGYLVVDDVLSPAEVQELNTIIDGYDIWNPDAGNGTSRPEPFSKSASGNKVQASKLHIWPEPFRRVIDHPKIVPYLTELIGPKFRYDHGYPIFMKQGGEKLQLHGGATPYLQGYYYRCHNGAMDNGLLVVSYALTSVGPGDGGFAAVPGSHKSNFPCPTEFIHFEDSGPWLLQVPQKAGSAIIFTEALTHGTWPWVGKGERRSLLYKYTPGYMAWDRNYPRATDVPEAESDSLLRRILEPPYRGRRVTVADGRSGDS